MKRCPMCPRVYGPIAWRLLPLVGELHLPADEVGPAVDLEHRVCKCGTVLAYEIEYGGPVVPEGETRIAVHRSAET